MIKCQLRRMSGRVPPGFGGVIGGDHRAAIAHRAAEDNAHSVAARIASRISERGELFELDSMQPRFFAKLARGGHFERFVLIHETAGESPSSFERLSPAFDEQDFNVNSGSMKQHDVDRDRRARMIVAIFFRWTLHSGSVSLTSINTC